MAGLALPTAAAIVLMFIAAGTAVATTRPAALMHNAAAMTSQPAVVESAAARASRLKVIENAKAVALAQSAAQATAATQAKAAVQAQAVARGQAAARAQAVTRAQAVARGQAVARVRAVAQKLSVTRSNQRKALVRTAARRAASGHSWRLPISHPVKTSGFGYRWGRLHAGEDFSVSVGTPLHSMSTGRVTFAGAQSGFGNIVQIRYWDGTISYFGHMSSISVHKGQALQPGQLVGRSGNTGHSTGPHLHLEIHPHGGAAIDPLPWLAAHHIAT
jgi:murein DD-endopeptidase MepM/ murein hydrolase activator NlpD